MKNRRSFGFTLVETIIAVAILAVVTVPVMGIFVQTSKVDSKSRQIQKATDLAQNVMESIRSYSMEEIMAQCMSLSEGNNTLEFITDWCSEYNPSAYQVKAIGDEDNVTDASEILQDAGNGYEIWGNAEATETSTEMVNVAIKGDKVRFAFIGIPYNSSTFNIIVSFDAELVPDKGEFIYVIQDVYYLYGVSVTVYQTHGNSSQKLAHITGAVQNRKNSPIEYDDSEVEEDDEDDEAEVDDEKEVVADDEAYDTDNLDYWDVKHHRWYPIGKKYHGIPRHVYYYDYDKGRWFYSYKVLGVTKDTPSLLNIIFPKIPDNMPWGKLE